MKGGQRHRKGNLFRHYMVQYLLLILLMLLALIPFYLTSFTTIRQNLQEKTEVSLQQGIKGLDHELKSLYGLSRLLAGDSQVLQAAQLSDEIRPADYLILDKAAVKFQQYAASLILSQDINLIFQNNCHLLMPGKVYPLVTSGQYPYEDFSPQDFEAIRNAIFQSSTAENLSSSFLADEKRQVLQFSLRLSGFSDQSLPAFLRAEIPMENLVEALALGKLQRIAFITVTDFSGKTLHSSDSPKINEEELHSFTLQSDFSNLSITVSIPRSYYTDLLKPVQNMILFYLAIALGVALVAAFAFSRLNSRPFAKILQSLTHLTLTQPELPSYRDDFQYIQYAIENMGNLTTSVQEHNQVLEKTVKTKVLEVMLTQPGTGNLDLFRRYFPDFPCPFRLLLVSAPEADLQSAMDEAGASFPDIFCLKSDQDFLVCLLPDQNLAVLKHQLESAPLAKQFRIALSQAFDSPDSICHANRQAHHIIRFLEMPGLIVTDEVPYRKFVADDQIDQKISEFLLAGDVGESRQLILTQWYELSLFPFPDNRVEQLFYQQTALLLRASQQSGFPLELPAFDGKLPLVDLALAICDSAQQLCEAAAQQRNRKTDETAEEIFRYVSTHALEVDFSSVGLSDRFRLSLKTINKLFKQVTGENISEYILTKKLEYAQALLRDSDRNINEITDACGFGSQNTFYKAFRRAYGISPSTYRENHQSSQS